jgi:raffinose/stachyose/melibiose transport system permease protein
MSLLLARRDNTSGPKQKAWTPYLYILPALGLYAFFILYPMAQTVLYSLHDWRGFGVPRFIWFDNYINLFQDPIFTGALLNNLRFITFYTLFPIVIGLLLTVLIARRRLFGLPFFRTALFMPQVMAVIVVGVVWQWIYNPAFGPLNELLHNLGLSGLAKAWLGDFDLALPAVGIVATWVQYGFCMVLFIAGVQRIEESLYDAAKIDGAGEWAQLRHITIPGLRAEISVALVTTLIAAMRVFDLVYVTTSGGPANRTMVAGLYMYQNAFEMSRVGYAATIAVVLTAIILCISYFVIRWRSQMAEE